MLEVGTGGGGWLGGWGVGGRCLDIFLSHIIPLFLSLSLSLRHLLDIDEKLSERSVKPKTAKPTNHQHHLFGF